jgi:hypothetical protein
MQSPQPRAYRAGSGGERDGGGMRAPARCGLALITAALISDLVVVLSFLPSADARVRGGTGHGLGWQTFQVKEFGTTVDYPAIIFSEPAGAAEKGTGQRFNSADGRSTFTIYALEKAGGDTPASYLRKNLRMPRSALDYERVTRSFSPSPWSGRARCSTAAATSQAATAARCIASTWSTRRTWLGPGDGIVTRISRSLRPLEG